MKAEKNSLEKEILETVTEGYLQSNDFNGISLANLRRKFSKNDDDLSIALRRLVIEEQVGIIVGEVNPAIIRLGILEPSKQLELLKEEGDQYAYVYPTEKHLSTVVPKDLYLDRPFTRLLALGKPQLHHISFELSILETYKNDPRYTYSSNDISGWISISDEYYDDDKTQEKDKTHLQGFGFSYDENMNRAVAVCLRYLSAMSPEHQQRWNTYRVSDDYQLHPVYFKQKIIGEWTSGISVFDAFLEEVFQINDICKFIEKPNLFNEDFGSIISRGPRPRKLRGFGFLLRPTSKEFNDFMLALDQLISDNINKKHFFPEISEYPDYLDYIDENKSNEPGTLKLLDIWTRNHFSGWEPKAIDGMINTFKRIRKDRQLPAHKLDDAVFDQAYVRKQRDLIIDAWKAVRLLRRMYSEDTFAAGYKPRFQYNPKEVLIY
jgi:hypothetical protein